MEDMTGSSWQPRYDILQSAFRAVKNKGVFGMTVLHPKTSLL
jgi:hypothetical protein